MKQFFIKATLAVAAIASTTQMASAFDLSSLLSGDTGSTITNLIEGVFTKTDLEVTDLAGEWTASGSAVCFQSENLLSKAGGLAAASAIETKLDAYYKQYGLTGAVFTIQTDGSFTMKTSRMSLSGEITKNTDGTFNFNFKAVGTISLGNITAYVQKSTSSMDIMFDAAKLKSLLSIVAKYSKNSLASTASTLLDSYDGMCVGFKLSQTGTVSSSSSTSTTSSSSSSATGSSILSNILSGTSNATTNNSTSTTKNTTTTTKASTAAEKATKTVNTINTLKSIFKK
jgi:hypothetical protein